MQAPATPAPKRRLPVAWLRVPLAWLIGAPGSSFSERVLAALTAAIVVVGFLLRMRGYLWNPPAFWLDECSWAMNLVEMPLVELSIRPVGFMAVSRVLAQVFSLSEPVLRFMPWFAGMAGVAIAPALARRLFVSRAARLLFVFIVALHPCLIDFSKEFKPYSVSFTLHLTLLLLTLRYLATKATRDLAWLLAAAAIGGLFAQDLMFAYPGVFLMAGWTALRTRREHVWAVLGTAALIVLLLVLQYVFIWSKWPRSDTAVWADKYNVFYSGKHSLGGWIRARHEGMAAFPGYRRKLWQAHFIHPHDPDPYRAADSMLWVILHVIGLIVIAWRRRSHALLLVLPIVVVWCFNLLTLWPIGAFRSNLFVILYMSGIACMAFEAKRPAGKLVDVLPAFVIVLAPFLFLDPHKSDHKAALTYTSEFPKAIRTLVRVKLASDGRERENLILDRRSCDPWRYYTEFHPTFSKKLKGVVRELFHTTCVAEDPRYRQALISATPRAPLHSWTILHAPKPVQRLVRARRLGELEQTYEEHVSEHTLMAFWRPAHAEAHPEGAPAPGEEEAPEEEGDAPPGGRFLDPPARAADRAIA